MAVFEKVIDAEGNETFREVDLGTLDVREHPEFQKVLKEQIKSRQKASELSKQLKALETPSGEEEAPEPEPATLLTVAPPDPEAIAELVEKRLAEKSAALRATQLARDTEITNALSKHGLPQSARTLIEDSINPDATAEKLAKSGLSFASTPSGGETTHSEMEDLFAKLDKRYNLGA